MLDDIEIWWHVHRDGKKGTICDGAFQDKTQAQALRDFARSKAPKWAAVWMDLYPDMPPEKCWLPLRGGCEA
jgi:hypothetical protein